MKSKSIITKLLSLFLGVMLMLPIFTASAAADSEASLEIVNDNGTVESYNGTFNDMRNKANVFMRKAHSANAYCTLSLNKDVVVNDTSIFSGTSSTYAHLTLDLNGFDLTLNSVNLGSNYFYYTNPGSITIDGEGEDGDVSKILLRSKAGLLYNNANSPDATIIIKNVYIEATNMSLGFCDNAAYPHQPILNLTAGTVTLDNLKITYTGTDAYAVEGSTGGADLTALHIPFVQANRQATITINNCEFIDTNTKGVDTYGIYGTNAASAITVTNTKINTAYAHYQTNADQKISYENCELRATKSVFYGLGSPKLTDCTVYAIDSDFVRSSIKPTLYYGTGKNTVYAASLTNGTYNLEEGYILIKNNSGAFIVADASGYSTVTLPAYYQSGMVFQRGEPINVSGFCNTDGNTVEVTLGDITKSVTVTDGKWSVQFDPMEATVGLTLSIKEAEPERAEPFVFDDVAIGDVFILSGQSNMDYQAKYLSDYEEFLANADNFDNLRGFLVPNAYRHGEDSVGAGTWYKLDKNNIGNFSAIGYVMATKLAAELDDVTIAIVDATYPGSIAKTWIDADTYVDFFGESHTDMKNYRNYLDFYQKNGRCPTSSSEISGWVGKSYQQIVASCYDSMIAFFDGYSAKATVWYQGEGDLGRVADYPTYFKALTSSFRKTFNNDEMAFVVIQLAPYSAGTSVESFRAMQTTLPMYDPYTYVVATSDEGAIYNNAEFVNNSDISLVFVHTSVKSPIGFNAADTVLSKVYGMDGANAPIEIIGIERKGSSVVITFNQPITASGIDEVLGFELAGSDGVFTAADAVIDGNTVTVTADGITEPSSVRYGFGSFYVEYQDGSIVIPKYNYSGGTLTTTTLTFTDMNGNTHTITRDAGEVIRSSIPGNVTSLTGAPLGVFSFSIID